MIAFLSGTVSRKEPHALILEVGGVGYRVFCPLSIVTAAKEKEKILLHIHQHIREDEISLFGFLRTDDLQFFEKLISVSGIGPRIALEVLEVPVHLVYEAVEQGDIDFLKTLKGIGRKTAERMVLELRGSLPLSTGSDARTLPPEVLQALTDLGFEKSQIFKAFQHLKTPLSSSEEMVKWFLQNKAG